MASVPKAHIARTAKGIQLGRVEAFIPIYPKMGVGIGNDYLDSSIEIQEESLALHFFDETANRHRSRFALWSMHNVRAKSASTFINRVVERILISSMRIRFRLLLRTLASDFHGIPIYLISGTTSASGQFRSFARQPIRRSIRTRLPRVGSCLAGAIPN